VSSDYFQAIINPNDPDGPSVQAVLPYRLILNYYKYHPVRYENLRAAKFVLDHPQRIFAGVRQFNEGGWCFTGRPKTWHVKEKLVVPFPDNLVFSVYLNSRFVIYEARAENAATDDPYCPENWQERYAALLWKNIF
jgi:hypothetical protein